MSYEDPEKRRARQRSKTFKEQRDNSLFRHATVKRYMASDKYREKNRRNSDLFHKRNPQKRRASDLLCHAVADGRIERGSCEACGSNVNVHGHHDDYSKPFEVRWLCPLCHVRHHKEES